MKVQIEKSTLKECMVEEIGSPIKQMKSRGSPGCGNKTIFFMKWFNKLLPELSLNWKIRIAIEISALIGHNIENHQADLHQEDTWSYSSSALNRGK